MSLVIRVKDATNTTIELGSVRVGTAAFATAAEQGTMAQGTIDIPDKGGVIRLAGLKEIWATEDDSPADNRIFWIGYLGVRRIHRGAGDLLTGSDRVISADVFDLNELLNDVIIKGAADASHGVRPAETDLARVAWVLQATPSWFPTAGGVAAVHDQGFVATTSGVAMDACDYRGQTPQAVLQDCADKSGRNWFIYFDEAAVLFALWYDKLSSANWPCALSFSNVPGDADNDLIWWMDPGPVEVQDPGKIASGIRAVYTGGEVFRHASDVGLSTATDFYIREQTAPSANTKTAAKAQVMADRMLRDNDEEENSASFEALLPSSKVGLVRAGMLVSCRFEHFDPPYRDWTDWRILRLEVAQANSPDWYRIKADVTPLTTIACSFVAPPSTGFSSIDALGGKLSTTAGTAGYVPAASVHATTEGITAVGEIYQYGTPNGTHSGSPHAGTTSWGITEFFLSPVPQTIVAWWKWDLNDLESPAICSVFLWPFSSGTSAWHGQRLPALLLEGSNDDSTWTTVVDDAAFQASITTYMTTDAIVPVSVTASYRYYRLTCDLTVPSDTNFDWVNLGSLLLWAVA